MKIVNSAPKNSNYISSQRLLTCLASLIILITPISSSLAAPDDIDLGFGGGDGLIGLGLAHNLFFPHPDGRLIVFGTGLQQDGTGFLSGTGFTDSGDPLGGNFVVTIDGGIRINDGVAQADGKMLFVGSNQTATDELEVLVIRLNADRTRDTDFGVNGIVTFDTGSSDIPPSNDDNYGAIGVIVDADGKIVLAVGGIGRPHTLVRLNSDGTFDPSLDDDGIRAIPESFSFEIESNRSNATKPLALQSDGKILLVGSGRNAASFDDDMFIIRFHPNGDLDTGFGDAPTDGGLAMLNVADTDDDNANSVVIQPDGKIVVFGVREFGNRHDLAVVRLQANGLKDLPFGFNDDGIHVVNSSLFDVAIGGVVLPDGRILAGGFGVDFSNPNFSLPYGLLVRFDTEGLVDPTFGIDGVSEWIGLNNDFRIWTPRFIQADGKILLEHSDSSTNIGRLAGDAIDTLPDSISFADQNNVATSTFLESNSVTVSGLSPVNVVPIVVENGLYSVNGLPYTDAPGYVENGDSVRVAHTSEAADNAATNTVLRIGGVIFPSQPAIPLGALVTDTFTSTTVGSVPMDTTPDAFSFTDQNDAALSTTITSNLVTISGIDAATEISVTGGEYSINAAAATAAAGTVIVGDSVTVSVQSSNANSATTSATLTIGSVAGTFSVTTAAATTGGGGGGGGNGSPNLWLLLLMATVLIYRKTSPQIRGRIS